MTTDANFGSKTFLSTETATSKERNLAIGAVAVSTLAFLVLVPFAKVQLAPVSAFIPIYQSSLAINDLITTVLLFGQFSYLRSLKVLLLACGYLFTSLMAMMHMTTFPGLFAPTGLFGAGPQSTAWLYMFWHGGFPIFVIASLHPKTRERKIEPTRVLRAIVVALVSVAAAAAMFSFWATGGQDWLPAIMQGNRYTPAMTAVVSTVWALSVLVVVVLWRTRPLTVLDLWLMVTMCAWVYDIALSAVLNGGRFDLGFYGGRIYGLLASSFVLVVLLVENAMLYARLAQSYESERQERQRAEEKSIELTAANENLDAFAHSVSHDLRAPLRAVSSYSEILEQDHSAELSAEGKKLLGIVRTRAARMGTLIDDLLAFSRLGRTPLKTSRVALNDLVNGSIEELRPSYDGRVIDFKVGELGTVEADPGLLKQVIENLLSNAIKYTRHVSSARVEIGARSDEESPISTIVFVKDNGAGFDMKFADKLFGVFQRFHHADQYEGTGIGLSIVRKIIERHGGRIWADSAPGAGSTFMFTLKRSR